MRAFHVLCYRDTGILFSLRAVHGSFFFFILVLVVCRIDAAELGKPRAATLLVGKRSVRYGCYLFDPLSLHSDGPSNPIDSSHYFLYLVFNFIYTTV